jgi:hypothetical protein
MFGRSDRKPYECEKEFSLEPQKIWKRSFTKKLNVGMKILRKNGIRK